MSIDLLPMMELDLLRLHEHGLHIPSSTVISSGVTIYSPSALHTPTSHFRRFWRATTELFQINCVSYSSGVSADVRHITDVEELPAAADRIVYLHSDFRGGLRKTHVF